jgi:hypothetical protein
MCGVSVAARPNSSDLGQRVPSPRFPQSRVKSVMAGLRRVRSAVHAVTTDLSGGALTAFGEHNLGAVQLREKFLVGS